MYFADFIFNVGRVLRMNSCARTGVGEVALWSGQTGLEQEKRERGGKGASGRNEQNKEGRLSLIHI